MRDRKLSDQTLPRKGSRNPSFTFKAILLSGHTKVKKMHTLSPQKILPQWPAHPSVRIWLFQSDFPQFAWREIGVSSPLKKLLSSLTVWM